jgi:hypothetical protein
MNRNLFNKGINVYSSPNPVRQYLWYLASATVDDVIEKYCMIRHRHRQELVVEKYCMFSTLYACVMRSLKATHSSFQNSTYRSAFDNLSLLKCFVVDELCLMSSTLQSQCFVPLFTTCCFLHRPSETLNMGSSVYTCTTHFL